MSTSISALHSNDEREKNYVWTLRAYIHIQCLMLIYICIYLFQYKFTFSISVYCELYLFKKNPFTIVIIMWNK